MKKFISFLVFFIMSITMTYGQLQNLSRYSVQDKNTDLGRPLPEGTVVYSMDDKKSYELIAFQMGDSTLNEIEAKREIPYGVVSPDIDYIVFNGSSSLTNQQNGDSLKKSFSLGNDVIVVNSSHDVLQIDTMDVPYGKSITILNGNVFNVTDKGTINGSLIAGQWQIFTPESSSKIISNASIDKPYLDWFGGDSDGIESNIEVFGKVYVGNKKYNITSKVSFQQEAIVVGDGNESELDFGGNSWEILNSISIKNLSIDSLNNTYGLYIDQTNTNLQDSIDITIDNVHFSNSYRGYRTGYYNSSYRGVNNLKITNCIFDNVGWAIECRQKLIGGALFQGNIFRNSIRQQGDSPQYCMYIGMSTNLDSVSGIQILDNEAYGYENYDSTSSNTSMFVTCYASDVLISGNHIHDTKYHPVGDDADNGFDGVYAHGRRTVITDNVFSNWSRGRRGECVSFKSAFTGGDYSDYPIVENNVFYRTFTNNKMSYTFYGDTPVYITNNYVYVRGRPTEREFGYEIISGTGYDEEVPEAKNTIIRDNWINTNRLAITAPQPNSYSDYPVGRTVVIEGNHITSSTMQRQLTQESDKYLIFVASPYYDVERLLIKDNMIETDSLNRGIYVSGGVKRLDITGNNFHAVGRKSQSVDGSYRYITLVTNGSPALHVKEVNISNNTFNIRGFPQILYSVAEGYRINNNNINIDYQLDDGTGTTGSKSMIILSTGTGLDETNNVSITGNILNISDSSYDNYASGQPIFFSQETGFKSVMIKDNILNAKNSNVFLRYAFNKSSADVFVSDNNRFHGFNDVYYGYGSHNQFIFENDIVDSCYMYLYDFSTANNMKLDGIKVKSSSNAIYIRGNKTNLFVNNCDIDGIDDFEVYPGITIENLYGLNAGEDYTWDVNGTINNVYGINQVETDIDGSTIKNNVKSLKVGSFNLPTSTGSAGQVLSSDGSGNGYWKNDATGTTMSYLTPDDFGAAGDGVTDDTYEVQKWIDSIGRSKVLGRVLYGKTYLVDSAVIHTNYPVKIKGDKTAGFKGHFGFSINKDFYVSEINYDMSELYSGQSCFYLSTSADTGINITVDGCRFTGGNLINGYTLKVYLDATDIETYAGVGDITYSNNEIINCRKGLSVESKVKGEVRVLHNIFRDYHESPTSDHEAFCLSIGKAGNYYGGADGGGKAHLVEKVLIDGNEAYNYQINNTSLINGSYFLRCYASEIIITNNFLHDTPDTIDMSSSQNYLDGLYLNGDDILVEQNLFYNWGVGISAVMLKNYPGDDGAHGFTKHQIIRNNYFIYDDSTHATERDRIIYADRSVRIEGNYIYDINNAQENEKSVLAMSSYGDAVDDELSYNYVINNWITSDRGMISVGGDRAGMKENVIEGNRFITYKSQPYGDSRYIIITSDSYPVLRIRNNFFNAKDGMRPIRFNGGSNDLFEITGNTFNVSLDTSVSKPTDFKVFDNVSNPKKMIVNNNVFTLKNVPRIGNIGGDVIEFSNNRIDVDFQRPDLTSTQYFVNLMPSANTDSSFYIRNNEITFTDSTTFGGPVFFIFYFYDKFNKAIFENNRVIGSVDYTENIAISRSAGHELILRNNEWKNLKYVEYGYGAVDKVIFENEKANDVDYYLYDYGGGMDYYISKCNISSSANAFYFKRNITNLHINDNIINGNDDFEVYTGYTITNLYGLNAGEDYTWDVNGAITNVYGINQVETDIDGSTMKNNVQSLKVGEVTLPNTKGSPGQVIADDGNGNTYWKDDNLSDGGSDYILFNGNSSLTNIQNRDSLKKAFNIGDDVMVINKSDTIHIDTMNIPKGKSLTIMNGVVFDVTDTSIVRGGLYAGAYSIFTVNSSDKIDVNGSKIEVAYPEWFGANGDSLMSDTTVNRMAIQSVLNMFSFEGNTTKVELVGNTYFIDSTIYIPPFSIFGGKDGSYPIIRNGPYMKEPFFYNRYEPVSVSNIEILPLHYSDMGGYSSSCDYDGGSCWRFDPDFGYKDWIWIQEWARRRNSDGNLGDDSYYRWPSTFKNIKMLTFNGELDRANVTCDGVKITPYDQRDADYYDIWENITAYKLDTSFYLQGYVSNNTKTFSSSDVDVAGNKVYIPNHNFVHGTLSPNREVTFIYKANTGDSIDGLNYGSYSAVYCYVPNNDTVVFQDDITSAGGAVQSLTPYPEGMINSLSFNNFKSDGSLHAIVIGDRAAGEKISQISLQPYTNTTYGKTVLLDVGSSYNVIDGGSWDMHCDSAIVFRSGTSGNSITNLGIQKIKDFIRNDAGETNVDIGYRAGFMPVGPYGATYGYYKLSGEKYTIFDNSSWIKKYYENTSENYYPRGRIDLVSSDTYLPPIVTEQQVAYKGAGDISTLNYTTHPYSMGIMTTYGTGFREGFGGGIAFYLGRDTLPDGTQLSHNYNNNYAPAARIYARADGVDNDSTSGALQFITGGSNISMTVRSDGKVGIGTTEPTKTLDVNGDIFVSGTITSNGLKAVSISDSLFLDNYGMGMEPDGSSDWSDAMDSAFKYSSFIYIRPLYPYDTSVYYISDGNVPDGNSLVILDGAMVKGKLTFGKYCSFKAGAYQVFDTSTIITSYMLDYTESYPEWFGAKHWTYGETDHNKNGDINYIAWQKTLDYFPMRFRPRWGKYTISNTIKVPPMTDIESQTTTALFGTDSLGNEPIMYVDSLPVRIVGLSFVLPYNYEGGGRRNYDGYMLKTKIESNVTWTTKPPFNPEDLNNYGGSRYRGSSALILDNLFFDGGDWQTNDGNPKFRPNGLLIDVHDFIPDSIRLSGHWKNGNPSNPGYTTDSSYSVGDYTFGLKNVGDCGVGFYDVKKCIQDDASGVDRFSDNNYWEHVTCSWISALYFQNIGYLSFFHCDTALHISGDPLDDGHVNGNFINKISVDGCQIGVYSDVMARDNMIGDIEYQYTYSSSAPDSVMSWIYSQKPVIAEHRLKIFNIDGADRPTDADTILWLKPPSHNINTYNPEDQGGGVVYVQRGVDKYTVKTLSSHWKNSYSSGSGTLPSVGDFIKNTDKNNQQAEVIEISGDNVSGTIHYSMVNPDDKWSASDHISTIDDSWNATITLPQNYNTKYNTINWYNHRLSDNPIDMWKRSATYTEGYANRRRISEINIHDELTINNLDENSGIFNLYGNGYFTYNGHNPLQSTSKLNSTQWGRSTMRLNVNNFNYSYVYGTDNGKEFTNRLEFWVTSDQGWEQPMARLMAIPSSTISSSGGQGAFKIDLANGSDWETFAYFDKNRSRTLYTRSKNYVFAGNKIDGTGDVTLTTGSKNIIGSSGVFDNVSINDVIETKTDGVYTGVVTNIKNSVNTDNDTVVVDYNVGSFNDGTGTWGYYPHSLSISDGGVETDSVNTTKLNGFVFPSVDGLSGQYLKTDGNKTLSWGGGSDYIIFNGSDTFDASRNGDSLKSAFSMGNDVIVVNKTDTLQIDTMNIPYGKSLTILNGAVFDIQDTSIINGSLIAGEWQIFTLSSKDKINASGAHVMNAFVEWFGAKGDGTGTKDMDAFEATLDVFCKPYEEKHGTGSTWSDFKLTGTGKKVYALGNKYIVEKTLNFPAYGNIEVGTNTMLVADTNDFFDSYVYFQDPPFHWNGGDFVIRPYSLTKGWQTSSQDENAKIQYSYNKNPVIHVSLRNPSPLFQYSKETYRADLHIENVNMRFMYDMSYEPDALKPKIYYDGIEIHPDTSTYLSPGDKFEYRRYYYIVKYVSGDDFSNINSGGETGYTGFMFQANPGGYPTDWTHGSVVREANNAIYGADFDNFWIMDADTSVYIHGGGSGSGAAHDISFNRLHSDGAWGGVVLGPGANTEKFYGLVLQSPTGKNVTDLTIYGQWNYFNGFLWDNDVDSSIIIRETAENNVIDLLRPELPQQTRYENDKPFQNFVGLNRMFVQSQDPSQSTDNRVGYYNWTGKGMKIGFWDNWRSDSINIDVTPRSVLDIVSERTFHTKPVLVVDHNTSRETMVNVAPTLLLKRSIKPGTTISSNVGPYLGFALSRDTVTDTWTTDVMTGKIVSVANSAGDTDNTNMGFYVKNNGSQVERLNIDKDGVTVKGDFEYDNDAYGEVKYSGTGVTISTSSTTNRIMITNGSNDMFTLEDDLNFTLSNDTLFYDKTGNYKVEMTGNAENASTTCSSPTIVIELYDNTDTKVDETKTTIKHCDQNSFPIPIVGRFDVSGSGYYTVIKASSPDAVDLKITEVHLVVDKK